MNKSIATIAVVLATAVGVHAQIRVNVDNQPISFQGTQPQQIRGRVMVPLRGVFEALGAQVDFYASSGSIVATRGSTRIEMKLGDRMASVNGREVMLDVPAMSLDGRTMVPLRFVGEAMGAEVRWTAYNQTVYIETAAMAGGGNTGGGLSGDVGANVEISEIEVLSDSDWFRNGDMLEVQMRGTPGGQASFRIIGLVDRVPMRETSPGVYRGSWRIPANANLSGARILGELRVNGEEKVIQTRTDLDVDTMAPRVLNVLPDDGMRVPANRLTISAEFDDGVGSGVRTRDVVLRIDGEDVTDEATITASRITWRPTRRLAAGRHTARLIVTDLAGNETVRTWNFVVGDTSTGTGTLTHDARSRVRPGDTIVATFRGEPDATVTLAIGNRRNIPMREVSDGVYEAEYVVRRGDALRNAIMVATVRTASGETYTVEADTRINGEGTTTTDGVTITSHRDGDPAPSDLRLRGTADPNARVRVSVAYNMLVFGLRVNGTLYEEVVNADDNGVWETETIRLRTPVSGSDTVYTVTATQVVAAGDPQPQSATIKLHRQ